MQNNYLRLFEELTSLVDDPQIYNSLDQHLKSRVDSLISANHKASVEQTIRELTINDTQILFTNNFSDFQPYPETQPLKERTNSNHPKRRQTLNSSSKITAKKIEVSAFDEKKESKQGKSKSRSLNKVKNQNKSIKDLIKYNLQVSKQKSKSKEKGKKLGESSSKRSIGYKPVQREVLKGIENIKLEKQQRQIKKSIDTNDSKAQRHCKLKTEESSISKLKTATSNLCESRQILKKIIQTQPSSAQKKQSTRQKRATSKASDKDITMMQAINKKLQYLNHQKSEYQAQASALHELIEKERCRIESINQNITKIAQQINEKQSNERSCSQQIKVSRKKSEHCITQSRKIQCKIVQVSKSKDSITSSIEQEKYLISVYLTVIDQIKSQLKIEQAQKIDLIKKLVTIKNTQKMIMEKYLSKQSLNEHIFATLNHSLKKWI